MVISEVLETTYLVLKSRSWKKSWQQNVCQILWLPSTGRTGEIGKHEMEVQLTFQYNIDDAVTYSASPHIFSRAMINVVEKFELSGCTV